MLDNRLITCYNGIAGKIIAGILLLVKTVSIVRIDCNEEEVKHGGTRGAEGWQS